MSEGVRRAAKALYYAQTAPARRIPPRSPVPWAPGLSKGRGWWAWMRQADSFQAGQRRTITVPAAGAATSGAGPPAGQKAAGDTA